MKIMFNPIRISASNNFGRKKIEKAPKSEPKSNSQYSSDIDPVLAYRMDHKSYFDEYTKGLIEAGYEAVASDEKAYQHASCLYSHRNT